MQNMNDPRLDALDLGSLRLLGLLLETLSVTRSAERLGVSQPTASRGLARLRAALGDELLVRARGGYALTPRAERLRPLVADASAALERVFAPARFDPGTSAVRFRVAANDHGALTVLAPGLARLSLRAPFARLDVVPVEPEALRQLEQGALDLGLWADDHLPADFYSRRLLVEGYAALVCAGHPLLCAAPEARIEELARFPQIVPMVLGPSGWVEDDALSRLGVPEAPVAVRTPNQATAPWMLPSSDRVLVLPRRLAALFAERVPDLVALPLDEAAATVELRLVWHARCHADPAHILLRGVLREGVGLG
jgi:DNA-binding transcriptional LysR family regulator